MNSKGNRIAVVGCGYWGKNLVRNFSKLSELGACVDPDPAIRTRLAKEYPGVAIHADYQTVLDDPAIKGIVLATPAPTHAELAIAGIRAGKHVFVEKPLALNSADAESVVSEARDAERVLMVGHLLEYHPAVNYMKRLIESDELGQVYYMYSQRVNLGKVRSDENALWSLAPHDISVALYLLGEEPVEVNAAGQAFLQNGVEDVVFVTLKFASGRVAHIHVSWLDPHKERRMTIVGSKKMVTFNDMQPQEAIRVFDKGVDHRPGEAAEYANYAELIALREGDIVVPRIPGHEPLALECAEFIEAMDEGRAPRSDGEDGLRVVRVLEAAQGALERSNLSFGMAPDERNG